MFGEFLAKLAAITTVFLSLLNTPQTAPKIWLGSPLLATSTIKITSPISKISSKTSTTTAQKAKTVLPVKPTLKASTTPQISIQPAPKFSVSELNSKLRESTVNIFCTTKTGGSFKPITGSGVIIDPRGVILTNAHVGQYFLLKDFRVPNFISCTIRSGSPAVAKYTAELMYISPRWINKNAQNITSTSATGTGENDFALLRITGTVSEDIQMPSSFPYSAPDTTFNSAPADLNLVAVAYPADLIGEIASQRDLWMVSSTAQIVTTFHYSDSSEENLDIFSLGGPIVSQGGSSGGPVVNSETGKLIGIITLSTNAQTTAEKTLYAITLSHIDRALKSETGTDLSGLLTFDPIVVSLDFKNRYFQTLSEALSLQIK